MSDESYTTLQTYPQSPDDEDDYYALLGLPRNPPPSDPEIRSAYRTLTFSFHPDKQPSHLREAAQHHFERIHEAYETLIDARKRTVYDILGAEGVRAEWSATGTMGGGAGGKREVGVKAKSPEEFRRWFLELMRKRERVAVNSMVQSRGAVTLGVDASDMVELSEDGTEFFVHVPEVKTGCFAVGYNFKAPFPTWEGVLGKIVKEDGDDDDDEKEEGKEKNAYDEALFKPELTINAGISGPVEHLVQEAQLRYEDGREGSAEVGHTPRLERRMRLTGVQIPLRPMMSTPEVTLGATVSRVFGDMTSTKGILGKWPFTYLSNSGTAVNAHILPFPFVTTSITKAVAPVPGAYPFRVMFSSAFMNWPHMTPPTVSLGAQKQISKRKHAFVSWSSGTLSWPRPIHRFLNPGDEMGINAGLAMAAFQQASSLNVGIISEPSRSQKVISLEDDEDDEEDVEFQELRENKRKADQAAESWRVQIQATPAQGALVFGYGRNLFSGKPANEPVRSEWTSEGYYGVPAEPETQSVRLEVEANVTLDMGLAFSVEGVRKVGEYTRMGLGVGLQGAQGLALTVSWSRLGQKLKLPITICTYDNINWDIGLAAVIFPWLTYCAVEFGFLRPRERKKRRRLVARKQKQLRRQIPKKKADSAQAIELMAEQVQRRQAREEAQNGLVITKAQYGYMSSGNRRVKGYDPKDYEVVDVTIPVAALVDRGQLVIPRETHKVS